MNILKKGKHCLVPALFAVLLLLSLSGCSQRLAEANGRMSEGIAWFTEAISTVMDKAQALGIAVRERRTPAAEPEVQQAAGPAVYTVLFIGSDRRDASWWGNADSVMLLSVNANRQTVSLISLMRDMGVTIPGYGYDKLNSSLAKGGPDLVVQTVAQNFGIGIDSYIFVDFGAMIRIVDLFGGVWLDVTQDEADVMNIYVEELTKLYGLNQADYWMPSGGSYALNGLRTLSYCRNRYSGNGDFERTARQRRVLSLLYEKMKVMSVEELQNMAAAILPSVQTNMSAEALAYLIPAVTKNGYAVVMDRVPYDGLYSYGPENIDPAWPETIARLQGSIY